MKTGLQEGMVVKSERFVNGLKSKRDHVLRVGYSDLDIKIDPQHGYTDANVDENRGNKEYLIVSVTESLPHYNSTGRQTSYVNEFVGKALHTDGKYDENGEEIRFSTAHACKGSIKEEEIQVVRQMKKTYV